MSLEGTGHLRTSRRASVRGAGCAARRPRPSSRSWRCHVPTASCWPHTIRARGPWPEGTIVVGSRPKGQEPPRRLASLFSRLSRSRMSLWRKARRKGQGPDRAAAHAHSLSTGHASAALRLRAPAGSPRQRPARAQTRNTRSVFPCVRRAAVSCAGTHTGTFYRGSLDRLLIDSHGTPTVTCTACQPHVSCSKHAQLQARAWDPWWGIEHRGLSNSRGSV